MVSKSEQLEQLFIEWEYAQENEPNFSWEQTRGGKNITKSHFRRLINDKQIPILRMWHTSYYQGRIEPLRGYANRIIGKLCAKCREEMERYHLI
jgi:hypothetical protein